MHFAHSLTALFGPCGDRTWADGPRFRTLGGLGIFPVRTLVISRDDTGIAKIAEFLAMIRAQKDGRPDWRRIVRDSPLASVNLGPIVGN